jgi:hypothetical protein
VSNVFSYHFIVEITLPLAVILLRNDGRPVSRARALEIIRERYTVPEEVRRRNNKRTRRQQIDRQAEKKEEGKRHQK